MGNDNNKKIQNELTDGIDSLRDILEKNEKNHETIIKKQIQIHKRQLNVSLVFVALFVLFFIISGIYTRYIVKQYLHEENCKIKENNKKQNVYNTVCIIKEFDDWIEDAKKKDPIFYYFIKNDTINAYKRLKQAHKGHNNFSDDILLNDNIHKFYGYYEVFKNFHKSKYFDDDVAFDLLYSYKNAGKDFKFIEKCRIKNHTDTNCDCGLIYNGYAYISEEIFHETLKINSKNDIPDN